MHPSDTVAGDTGAVVAQARVPAISSRECGLEFDDMGVAVPGDVALQLEGEVKAAAAPVQELSDGVSNTRVVVSGHGVRRPTRASRPPRAVFRGQDLLHRQPHIHE